MGQHTTTLLLLVVSATTTGCAGDKGDEASPDTAEDCSDFEGTISADLVAATPRDGDVHIEGLALCMSDWGVAWPEMYDRVSVDVPAVRAAWPDLAAVEFRFQSDPYEFEFHADNATWDEIIAGTYHAWDCSNVFYGLQSLDIQHPDQPDMRYGYLAFKGIYDMNYIIPNYRGLPGILEVDVDGGIYDGSNIWGLVDEDGTYQYLFDLGEDGCIDGCLSHTYTWISSPSPGVVTREASWVEDTGNRDEEPPDWVTAYDRCGNESLDYN